MQFKSIGVVLLLLAILLVTGWLNPSFLSDENVKSIITWTSLFGFISLGMSLVIMTGGIDLSIGSVIALAGVSMLMLLDQRHVTMEQKAKVIKVEKVVHKNGELPKVTLEAVDWPIKIDDQLRFTNSFGQPVQGTIARVEASSEGLAVLLREPNATFPPGTSVDWFQFRHRPIWIVIPLVLFGAAALGWFHGLLVTKVGLQPFVVTMCGLLAYRGIARVLAGEQSKGLGSTLVQIKEWINGVSMSVPIPFLPFVSQGHWHRVVWDKANNQPLLDAVGNTQAVEWASWIRIPNTAVLLAIVATVLWIAINRSVFGRYLMALGNNVQAAKFSGIATDRIIISTYVICSLLAGLTGILLVFDFNTIEPSQTGSIYEMYAVAAAVIGGCSLRGGTGSIIGVVVGTAVMRSLFLSIAALSIPKSWEFIIVAIALLAAVLTDEIIRIVGNHRKLKSQAKLAKTAES
jgi:ribose transport system permease protein